MTKTLKNRILVPSVFSGADSENSEDKGVELLLSSSVNIIKEKTLISELRRNKPNNETKGTNHYNITVAHLF